MTIEQKLVLYDHTAVLVRTMAAMNQCGVADYVAQLIAADASRCGVALMNDNQGVV